MFNALIRHAVFPLHEMLNGRPTMRAWRKLERSQHASPAELRTLQLEKLAALLRHANARVPWYRRMLRDTGLTPTAIRSFDDLARLPILDRAAVRDCGHDMIARGWGHRLRPSSTSGSTGSPVTFWIDPVRAAYNTAARLRAQAWFGVQPGDRGVFLWGGPLKDTLADRVRRVRDSAIGHELWNAYDASPRRLAECARRLARVRPAYIYGFAGAIYTLADFAEQNAIDLGGVVRKAIFTTAEVLRPQWRECITRVFGRPVADEYGCREGDMMAHLCPAGGYHVMAENVILETVRADGSPADVGTPGDLIVTNLNGYAMPFVRYRTGDVVTLLDGRCRCGRALPVIDQPAGRRVDFLRSADGAAISGQSVTRDILAVAGVYDYRVLQDRADRVRVTLVGGSEFRPDGPTRLMRVLQDRLGPTMTVDIEQVDRLPPHPSGKHHYVQCRLDGENTADV